MVDYDTRSGPAAALLQPVLEKKRVQFTHLFSLLSAVSNSSPG